MNRNASGYASLRAASIQVTGTIGTIETSAGIESKTLLFEPPAALEMLVTPFCKMKFLEEWKVSHLDTQIGQSLLQYEDLT